MAVSTLPPEMTPQRSGWIRRNDQATVASIVAIGLSAIVAWWFVQGGAVGGLVEVDQAARQSAAFQIDLNAADWAEIEQLPDIGPVLAKRVVAYRDEHGRYNKLDELRNVRGIGPITFGRISPFLRPIEPVAKP